MTNADKIRNMSNDELIIFLMDFSEDRIQFLDGYYCNHICKFKVNGKCTNVDDIYSCTDDSEVEELEKYLQHECED